MSEKTFLEYTIKIRIVKDKKRIGAGGWKYKDKFYLVDIKTYGGGGVSFGIQATGNYGRDLRKVFREIKENLHL